MKPFTIAAAVLSTASLLTAACPAAPVKGASTSPSRSQLIVPGKSVGKVWLGATRLAVRLILGAPKASHVRTGGIAVDEWLGPPVTEKDSWAGASQRRLAVLFVKNRAVQIELNSPNFATKDGITSRNSLGQFRQYYRPRLKTYLYQDEGGGGYRGYIYDDVKRGLAFTFGAQDSYDAKVLPETLRVHRPGVFAIPDPGGQPRHYNDEIPVTRKTH